jgi:hypothetical protein
MLSSSDLYVYKFVRVAPYGPREEEVDLATLVEGMRPTLDYWAQLSLIKRSDSFGFAAAYPGAAPTISAAQAAWDYPYKFVWFVVGWGPRGNTYIANAVRMLRPSLRTGKDTLALRQVKGSPFWNAVRPMIGDIHPWGDYPRGGATIVRTGNIIVPCAVDGFREVENDFVAKTIGSLIGSTILKMAEPELFVS